MGLYEAGTIKPVISERFDLEHAPEAIARLAARQALGKLVITME